MCGLQKKDSHNDYPFSNVIYFCSDIKFQSTYCLHPGRRSDRKAHHRLYGFCRPCILFPKCIGQAPEPRTNPSHPLLLSCHFFLCSVAMMKSKRSALAASHSPHLYPMDLISSLWDMVSPENHRETSISPVFWFIPWRTATFSISPFARSSSWRFFL